MPRRRSRRRAGRKIALLLVIGMVAGLMTAGIALPAIGSAGLAGKSAADSFQSMPSELATPPLPQRTRMVDRNGNLIATFYDENRVNVRLSDVAPIMRKAIVAIEDSRFYQHGPIDYEGTLRALIQNQTGDNVQGGSTLAQQYVKLVQVEQAQTPAEVRKVTNRTGIEGYARKVQELRYASALEQRYSKDEILERYLNIAYFGSGAYGIESAAEHYFSTSAKDLTLAQSALIAGIVRSPYAYDPIRHPRTAKLRRDTVLQRMADTHAITQTLADSAKKAPLGLKIRSTGNGCSAAGDTLGFFCEYVAQEILLDPAFGKTYHARLNALYKDGLTVRTTLDPKSQQAAVKAVRHNVYKSSSIAASLVSIEPGTGAVRAMVISKNYTTARHPKKKQLNFNPAVDRAHGGGSGAQYGSNAKAFTLAAALQSGMPLSHTINAPGSISNMRGFKACDGESISYPHVGNAAGESEHGKMNLVEGTVKSVNTFFVTLEHQVGLCKVWRMAKKLGMKRSDGKSLGDFPSLTLGADEVDPLHVASAYATFAADGTYCRPNPFESVEGSTGKDIPGLTAYCSKALSGHVADGVVAAMKPVLTRGTAKGNSIGRPAAGKTGTTDKQAAGWFTGYTPDLATSIALYSPKSTAHHRLRGADLGPRTAKGFGADAAPIWKQMMEQALEGTPKHPFGQRY
ncbi:MAG: penicillin-binding protein, partial [Acidothermales bacterium]|nr:penicillin-binding protein [Acidothermales bacterium]